MNLLNKESIAERAIKATVLGQNESEIGADQVEMDLRKIGAAFVTIYVDTKLRGCIGSIEANEALYLNIRRNAINAVTRDFRFLPINKDEIRTSKLRVEVSVLSPLKRFKPKTSRQLLIFLKQYKPGLVIKKNGKQAVFLPQVWQQIVKELDFLKELCRKAGLSDDAWKSEMEFYVFTVKK